MKKTNILSKLSFGYISIYDVLYWKCHTKPSLPYMFVSGACDSLLTIKINGVLSSAHIEMSP